jgi:hypothetical protein
MPWKKVIDYIAAHIQPEDMICIVPAKQKILFGYYADGPTYHGRNRKTKINKLKVNNFRKNKRLEITTVRVNFVWENELVGIRNIEHFKRVVANKIFFTGNRNLWFIITRWVEDPELIKDHFDNFYMERQSKHFDGISVSYYVPKF